MDDICKNIFSLPEMSYIENQEFFEQIISSKNVRIERIISKPFEDLNAPWYDQDQEEWVILLSGKATIELENSIVEMHSGDYIYIAAHQKHRVINTIGPSPCIWLAIHIH